jgi:hypothetical protein
MSRFNLVFIFCFLILHFNSCGYIANYQLVGVWRVSEIFENEKILKDKTLESIILQFSDEGHYIYQGTLNYREAGTYKISSNSLFLSNQSSEEKEIHIASLNSRKLTLLMKDAGKIRKMIFNKVGN